MPDTDERVCRQHEVLAQTLERLELSVQDGFASVNTSLREVAKDLRDGAVEMATLRLRISVLERLVFGAVALALSGLVAGVLALIIKT